MADLAYALLLIVSFLLLGLTVRGLEKLWAAPEWSRTSSRVWSRSPWSSTCSSHSSGRRSS